MVGSRERDHLLAHFVLQGRQRFSLQQGPRQPVLRVRGRGWGEPALGGGESAPDCRLDPGGYAQFGQLDRRGSPYVLIKVKTGKTEETK